MTKAIMSLAMARSGKELLVIAIEGGWGARRRLTEMGLREGAHCKLIQSSTSGPRVVLAGNTRLALGYGMCQKILVQEI
ncbi:MAG: ferrous iron transport protein A [Candidatus Omnitrophica bacterium]|nr:ferrous iron transport protein A [Candidatus Omnitrophota bacterium]